MYSASFDENIKVPRCIVFEKTQKSKNDVKNGVLNPQYDVIIKHNIKFVISSKNSTRNLLSCYEILKSGTILKLPNMYVLLL